MEKEKVFTNRSQLTVGIVSLLPSNHYLAEIKDVFTDILRYSTLLKVVASPDPDMVITLSEHKGGVRLTMNHGDNVLIDAVAEITSLVPSLMSELYLTVHHLLMQEKEAIEEIAYDKWVDQYNIPPERRNVVFTLTNTVSNAQEKHLERVANGYVIGFQTVLDEIIGREKEDVQALDKVAIQAKITIQEIPDDPGNIEVLFEVTPAEGCIFIQMKRSPSPFQTFFETLMKRQEDTERLCTKVIHSKLDSKNLHNANMQKALLRMRDANEFANILLLDFEDEWINEIEGVMHYLLFPEMASNNLSLIDVPKESLLPFKVEEVFTYQPTANLVGADIREVMSQPTLDSVQKPVEMVIDYQKEVLSVSCKLDGRVLAKAEVALVELQNNNQKTMIFAEIKEKMLNDFVIPLSIAALKTQAQA